MKDLVIPAKTLRQELWILLGCLGAAILVNAGAIIAYDRPWKELFTQIGYTLTVTILLYLVLLLGRGLVAGLIHIIRKINRHD